MITYEHFISLPIVGRAFTFMLKAFNGKMNKEECLRVHQSLDQRLEDIHEDLKFIKEHVK